MAEVSEMLLWYEGSWSQQDVGLNLDSMLLTILDRLNFWFLIYETGVVMATSKITVRIENNHV